MNPFDLEEIKKSMICERNVLRNSPSKQQVIWGIKNLQVIADEYLISTGTVSNPDAVRKARKIMMTTFNRVTIGRKLPERWENVKAGIYGASVAELVEAYDKALAVLA